MIVIVVLLAAAAIVIGLVVWVRRVASDLDDPFLHHSTDRRASSHRRDPIFQAHVQDPRGNGGF